MSEPKQIRVYAFGELEPGTELVLKSAFDELKRELELAVAHDRQAYPTAAAYEQVCKVLNSEREKSDSLAKQNVILKAALRNIKAHETTVWNDGEVSLSDVGIFASSALAEVAKLEGQK